MKRNLFAALLIIVSCNRYALPTQGGRLISQSEKLALNTTLSFKHSERNIIQTILKQNVDSKTASYIRTTTNIEDISIIGKKVVIKGSSNNFAALLTISLKLIHLMNI